MIKITEICSDIKNSSTSNRQGVTYELPTLVAIKGWFGELIAIMHWEGVKVGVMRLEIVWPFPETRIRELSKKVKAFVVPEINYGQIVLEVERCAAGNAAAIRVPHGGGGVHDPEDICNAIVGAAK